MRAWLATGQDRVTFAGAATSNLVCWDQADCTRMITTDVTGDGASDDVALVGRLGDETHQVRVRTSGAVQTATVETPSSGGGVVWVGASGIDDVAGAELVLLSEVGAHAERNSVLTWRQDRLVIAPAPDATPEDSSWWVDASANSNMSITCEAPGRLTLRFTYTDDDGDLFGYMQPYESLNGSWSEVGDLAYEPLPDGPTSQYSGWYCPGLPRFAT